MHDSSVAVGAPGRYVTLLVLVLLAKNATWSILFGQFANAPVLPSALWWYGLVGLFLLLSSNKPKPAQIVAYVLLSLVGCIGSAILAYQLITSHSRVVVPWYDFGQLALCFVWLAVYTPLTCAQDGPSR